MPIEPKRNRTILLTGNSLSGFSGSELHILKLSTEFAERGYTVFVSVFNYANPLLQKALDAGVHVLNAYTDPLPSDHFDIVFIHHFPVADYLIAHNDFSFDRLVVSSLGNLGILEMLPHYASEADVLLFVSEQTRQNQLTYVDNVRWADTFVFNNYAPPEFFKAYQPKQIYKIQKIAVVTNHICDEVLEFCRYAHENGYVIDCFGVMNYAIEITADLLSGYDLVITIGRTVQYCLAQGIPVYCYDWLGGPGFITKENFEVNKNTNFSGRSTPVKKTSKQIFEDITTTTIKADDILYLANAAHLYFDFQTMFDAFLAMLYLKEAFTRNLKRFITARHSQYTEAFARKLFQATFDNGQTQIYFDYGNGFTEEKMQNYPIIYDTQINLDINIPQLVSAIRFDPNHLLCKCKIISAWGKKGGTQIPLSIVPVSFYETIEGWDYLLTRDPQYLIAFAEKTESVQISFVLKRLDAGEIAQILQCEKVKNNYLQKKINSLEPIFKKIVRKLKNRKRL